jgi:ParB-like chromosome segregation protein Spo0J
MTQLAIDDLLATPVDPTAHLDEQRVERYRRDLDGAPPVVVFETERGLLLVDGFHRVEAARREGRTTIEAVVRNGSRAEALAYAAELGAKERGIAPELIREHLLEKYGSDQEP